MPVDGSQDFGVLAKSSIRDCTSAADAMKKSAVVRTIGRLQEIRDGSTDSTGAGECGDLKKVDSAQCIRKALWRVGRIELSEKLPYQVQTSSNNSSSSCMFFCIWHN